MPAAQGRPTVNGRRPTPCRGTGRRPSVRAVLLAHMPVPPIRRATVPEDPGAPPTSPFSLLGAFVIR
ncbi:predicted protein [Streptomyces pristinaespiralis ATCC 25486]|uniref:Predicted protein n=1 Tax=Streptomyces pristinaespiralis (strain ATCC 25486 / DSM 40338 / CBS 914.69 / JCM 4507 / KCC S-0507 / NBRC 13074 / NRRL 2958 / 5647) TaxID=457429 RepID=D6X5K7_STRE2|nr:predicted protein [Streptomyces pristinaespiralis ATCC 25486]